MASSCPDLRRSRGLKPHPGFFYKYTFTKDEEKRRSKQISPASLRSRRSTASASSSPLSCKPTSPASPSTPTSLNTSRTLAQPSSSASFHTCRSQASKDRPIASGLELPRSYSYHSASPSTRNSSTTRSRCTTSKSPITPTLNVPLDKDLPSSSALSTPPASTLRSVESQSTSLAPSSSRKRKRTPLLNERKQKSQTAATAACRRDSSQSPHNVDNPKQHGRSNVSVAPSSSLSMLSHTPAQPSQSPRPSSYALSVPCEVPTSSLTVLSQTPSPLDDTAKQKSENIGDSQDSEELSDEGVFEEEKKLQQPTSLGGTFCVNDDSEEELASLDDLFSTGKKPADAQHLANKVGNPRPESAGQAARSPRKAKKRYSQYSLTKLVEENEKDVKRLQQIQDMQAVLDAAEAKEAQYARAMLTASDGQLDTSAFSTLVANEDDEDRAERLKLAVKRQELLNGDIVWHFFDLEKQKSDFRCEEFPESAVENHPQLVRLSDSLFREQAFLTGFAGDWLGSCKTLPGGLMNWLWKVSIYEPRDDLRHAYCNSLRACAPHIKAYINFAFLSRPLKAMGARWQALAPIRVLEHTTQPMNEAPPKPPAVLHRFIKALQCIAHSTPPGLLPGTISVLLRLGIDRTVNEDFNLLPDFRALLSTLIEASHTAHDGEPLSKLGPTFTTSLTHPVLQRRLLSILPDISPPSLIFKRKLALAFFLSSPTWLHNPLTDAEAITRRLIKHIKSHPAFNPSHDEIDYRAFDASIAILDTAIGPGFIPPADSSPRENEDLKTFNHHVDALSAAINVLAARIPDTGASHMLRTTAKSSLHRLQFRLDYVVRTRPRPRRDFLSGDGEGRQMFLGTASGVAVSEGRGKKGVEFDEGRGKRGGGGGGVGRGRQVDLGIFFKGRGGKG